MTEDEVDQKLRAVFALRDALFDEIDRMRAGKANTADAKQLAKHVAALRERHAEENENDK
jgi:hypothetical protein